MSADAVSFGGGVQSTALLALAAQGAIDYRTFLFANVGTDSEHPATVAYYRDHHRPYAEAHGLELHEVKRDGPTLLATIADALPQVPIPMYLSPAGQPANRTCTTQFKIAPVYAWQRARGASKKTPARCALGISTDEIGRMRTTSTYAGQTLDYPLIDLGLSREDCHRIIADAGLPPAPRSACWFCPFHRLGNWADRRQQDPALFGKAVALEATINEARTGAGLNPAYLSRRGLQPLDDAIPDQPHLFDPDEYPGCDEGSCWT